MRHQPWGPHRSRSAPGEVTGSDDVGSPDDVGRATTLWVAARASVIDLTLLVAAMLLVYLPVGFATYAFMDDYSLLYRAKTAPDAILDELVGAGRPVTGLADRLVFSLIGDISDLRWLRLTALVGVLLFLMLLLLVCRAVRIPRWLSFAIPFAVGVLPSSVIVISWPTTYHVPMAMLFGASAALVARPLPAGAGGSRPSTVRIGGATLLLTAGLCDYQPAAMTFWLVLLIMVLAPTTSPRGWRRLLLTSTVAAGIFAVAAFLQLAVLQIGIRATGVTGERASLVSDLRGKVDWYSHSVVPSILAPYPLTGSHRNAEIAGAVILLGLVLLGRRNNLGVVLTVAVAFGAVAAASTPNLVTAENWASARSLSGLMPLGAVLAGMGALGYSEELRRLGVPKRVLGVAATAVFAGLVLIAALATRAVVVDYVVDPQSDELAKARRVVATALSRQLPVILVPSSWTDTLATQVVHDEFGIPSTCQGWVPIPLFQLLAKEQTGHWFRREITQIDNPVDGSSVAPTPGHVTIDFGHMLQPVQGRSVYGGAAAR